MLAMTPAWLTLRDGDVRSGMNASTLLVSLSHHPQYRLFATPAEGQFTCVVTQSNNGKRLDGGKKYETVAAALAGGLEELREKLGW